MDKQILQKAVSLWLEYVQSRRALLADGYIRSFKKPEADFSEWLVAFLFDGRLPPSKTNPGYDVITDDKRIQVKSVAKAADNKNGYIIDERDRSNDPRTGATHYAFVFFDELIPSAIFLAPEAFVRNFGSTQIRRSDLEKKDFKIDVDLNVFNDPILRHQSQQG